MNNSAGVRTVLIVDRDLAFAMWMSQLLFSLRTVNVIPAESSTEALAIIDELNLNVDLLLVDLGLSGVQWLIKALEAQHRDLRVVLIGDDIARSQDLRHDAIMRRPIPREPVSWSDCLPTLRKLLIRTAI